MVDIIDANFDKEVIEKSQKIPVIVDFWAPWCGPCLMLKPIMEKLEKRYKGKIIIAKLNVEENTENASNYEIMSIPAVKLFKDGKVVDGFVGLKSEVFISEWIDQILTEKFK